MGEQLNGEKRTCMCTELGIGDVGKTVTLMGWVQRRRDLGSLIFIWLRDRSGIIQVVFDEAKYPEVFEKATALRSEYVISVKGEVIARDEHNINPALKTGQIEVEATQLKILSEAETPPFFIDDEVNANDAIRYKYRYLDLRRPYLQKILVTRSKTAAVIRNYFNENGFVEVETPVLTKSTPEGARDYLVPSRVHPGEFYALPQSPQLLKQLLMISGMDRYYQIVKCFRDEDLRADRQPEFTQVDVEMSFVDVEDVLAICEGMIKEVFSKIKGIDVQLPLPRMTYQQAMDLYGSDKPDTRFGMTLVNISDIVENCGFSVFSNAVKGGGSVRLINAEGLVDKFTRKEIDALTEYVKTYKAKGLAWLGLTDSGYRSSFAKFMTEDEVKSIILAANAKEGDMLFFIADSKNDIVYDALGQLRLEIGRRFNLIDKSKYNFLWVTEFPLFEYSEEDQRFYAKHHPFTAPMDEDMALLDKDRGKMRAKAYDIVLNGYELGGGSIRIHDSNMQKLMFNALGFSEEDIRNQFGFFVDAFKYGAPPHGGFAIGLDRLTMLLCGTDNIRDVIAFPKMQNASCLMTDAPSPVSQAQLNELKISTMTNE